MKPVSAVPRISIPSWQAPDRALSNVRDPLPQRSNDRTSLPTRAMLDGYAGLIYGAPLVPPPASALLAIAVNEDRTLH